MMGLKSSRKLLSVLLTAVITFCICAISFNVVEIITQDNNNFYIKALSDDNIVTECEKQLDIKYEALSVKTNIPFDIFSSVKNRYITKESLQQAASYLFDENDSKLRNDVREQYFVDVCEEYFHANNIDYDEDAVRLACKEASDIYSDTVGIHNLDYLKDSIVLKKTMATRKISFYVVYAVCSIICLCMLYRKKKEDRMLNISYSFFSSAIACFLSSLLIMIFKNQRTHMFDVEPEIYAKTFLSMSASYANYLMLAAFVILLLAVALFIIYVKLSQREQFRKNTRFEKIIHKL